MFEKVSDVATSPRLVVALAYNIAQTLAWGSCAAMLDNAVRWSVFDPTVLASRTWPAMVMTVLYCTKYSTTRACQQQQPYILRLFI